jgi:hypothetical protein
MPSISATSAASIQMMLAIGAVMMRTHDAPVSPYQDQTRIPPRRAIHHSGSMPSAVFFRSAMAAETVQSGAGLCSSRSVYDPPQLGQGPSTGLHPRALRLRYHYGVVAMGAYHGSTSPAAALSMEACVTSATIRFHGS